LDYPLEWVARKNPRRAEIVALLRKYGVKPRPFPETPKEEIDRLIGWFRDTDPRKRWMALMSLSHHGPGARAAVPALLQMLHDPNPAVRTAAEAAIKEIDPDALPPDNQ
jgi:hypothetical protein